ncbi:pimeloyl-ACP methyl ester carboxylesterase [Tamaricihabitans halophyticus]|uniref:Pimeloyl-ACP methyl ester carboxylesterase n=1 Tax=Tamaricihabitans halophyticus TaxID=1262583 RepID=A0A4R2R6F2_9PSEU|nr:alpha/beta hydrolase [Tamaricihabitans halophyticus]TCP57449.1 pimeloyl-ACP methyl ester carboxylesterase [Tamaricihabitans halophyticus]
MSWTLRETYSSTNGLIRWDRWGSGDPVVFLHGTPFSSYVWRDIASSFARTNTVYVWDMPGYGQSEMRDDQDVSLAGQGSVFAELLEHWGLREPTVVAHDFGGAVALRAHLLHSKAFRKLALVDVVAVDPWGSEFFRLVREYPHVFEQLPDFLHRALVRDYINAVSSRGVHPAVLDELIRPWATEQGQRAFYRQIAQADQRHTDEVQIRYGEISIPVQVCWGVDDTWIPLSQGEKLASLIPGSGFTPIENAGHLVHEDAPAQLSTALHSFIHRKS